MNMFKWLVLLLFCPRLTLKSQIKLNQPDYVEASLFIHTIGIPDDGMHFSSSSFTRLGFGLGTGWKLKESDKSATIYQLSLKYYRQKDLHYGIHIHNELLKTFAFGKQIEGFAALGGGYLHLFEDAPLYKLKHGIFARKREFGRPQFVLTLSLGLVVSLSKSSPYSITFSQKVVGQLPFATKTGLPLLLQHRTMIGFRKSFVKYSTL